MLQGVFHWLFTLGNGESDHFSTSMTYLGSGIAEGATVPCKDFPGFTGESSQAALLLINAGSDLPHPWPCLANAEVRWTIGGHTTLSVYLSITF